jgi:plastocyanin
MLRRIAFPLAILTGLALFATPAEAATVQISIVNFGFSPTTVTVPQGGTATWTNNDGTAHTSTSNDGFWGSPHIAPGTKFSESTAFLNAGSYGYHCNIHPEMHGTVKVPLIKTGTAAHGYTLRWSSASSAAGHNFDVQIKRPGQSTFTSFRSGTTALKAFVNPAKAGTYKFRSRTRITSSGKTSGFSPVLTLSIS